MSMQPMFALLREAIHRHHRHHHHAGHLAHRGFAGFGGRHGFPGDPRGMGIDGLNRGRKLGSADLQLLLLALLAEQPSHGYELIKALDERSNGYYSPSPGMVYPALTYLEELGLASVEPQGPRKRYSITADGLAHLQSQRAAVDGLLEQLARIGQRMGEMRRATTDGQPGDAATDLDMPEPTGGHERHAGGNAEVHAARRSLKSALIEKWGSSATEQRRIAQILERAAAQIRGDAPSE